MALIDTFRRWLGTTIVKAALLPIVPEFLRHAFMAPTFRVLSTEGYKGNGAVFGCISALAFAFPEPPLLVWEETDSGKRPLRAHPLSKLLRRPNEDMGLAELLLYTIVYLAIGGNCYWYKVRSRAGRVVELWPLHDGQIRPVAGGGQLISHYEFDDGTGIPQPVAKSDIVHFKWMPDPLFPHKGLAPLVAVAREVDTDNEATRYLFSLLKNDALPRIALIVPKEVDVDEDERKRLKAQFNQEHGGENRGKAALLKGGLDIKTIALNLKEMEFNVLRRVPEARLCSAFRVPPIVAGLNVGLENSTYSNFHEAILLFTERTLVPLWGLVDDKITSDLLPEFNGQPNEVVEFDLDKVVALAEKKAVQRQWASDGFTKGGLTKNEFRAVFGLPRDLNGDVYFQPISVIEVPAAFAVRRPDTFGVPDGGEAETVKAKPAMLQTKGQQRRKAQEAIIAAQRTARREVAGRMEAALGGYFQQLADHVMHRARKGWTPAGVEKPLGAPTPSGCLTVAKKLPKAEDLLDDDDLEELESLIKRYYVEVMELSWGYWDVALGVETAFDLSDPAVTEVLAGAGKRVKGIHETTLESLRALLQYGNEQGWSVDQLARGDPENGIPGLRDLIEQTYKNRARTVARTELGNAQNMVATGRYEQAGVQKVLVLDNGDDDDDSACKAVNGTVKTVAWAQENPLEHPNCTRAFAPEFDR